MKRTSLSLLFILVTLTAFCQVRPADSSATGGLHFFQPGKYDFGLNLGSSFTSMAGYGSGLTTEVSPHVFYNVSKRFRISAGISVATTHYYNARSWFANESAPALNGNFTTGTVFVSGTYLVNERLSISGSAFKTFPVSKDPLFWSPFNPISPNGAQGVNFSADYKVAEHVHIQAGFRYSRGINNYSPFGISNDPFQPGPVRQGFGYGNQNW
ncbi:MAG: hypothetical protein WCO44_16485 [Bacteroidota bacterium]